MKIVLRAPDVQFSRVLILVLFYFAIGCLFASLATAPGQLYLGRLYYIKDAGVILCFLILAGRAAMRNDKLTMLVVAVAAALIFIFAPALRKDDSPSTALNIAWIIKWAMMVQLGILAYRERLYRSMAAAVSVLLVIICVDGLVGLWEIHNNTYFFEMSAMDETAAGVAMVKQEQVGEMLRVLAIHRSGGDFGNSMATGMILCGFLILVRRRAWEKLLLTPLFLLFAYDLFFSTVRSFLVGATAGVAALACHLLLPRRLSRYSAQTVAALILVCLFFSYFNIIPVVEFVSKHLLSDTDIGSVNSSYMRLDTWDDVFREIKATPIVALIGGPLASALSFNTLPSEICDNIYLWLFYHLGAFGLLAFLICIPLPLAMPSDPRVRALYFAATTQLLVTGIFTDSLFYFSSLILFFALGLILAEQRGRRMPVFVNEIPEAEAVPELRESEPSAGELAL